MKRYFSYIIAIALLLPILGSACRDDDFSNSSDLPGQLEGTLKVLAKIHEPASTRSYFGNGTAGSGPVVKGKFTLAYPYTYAWQPGDGYGYNFYFYYRCAEVNFGFAGQETIGFVNRGTATDPVELTWSSSNSSANWGIIYYPAKTNPSPLFLDNFPYKSNTAVDSILNISKDYPDNPFKPGVFDAENGTNDLLWGTAGILSGEDFVEFELYHRMTRLNITVNVENNENENFLTSLKNARVWIEGLLLNPITYARKYGTLEFREIINVNSQQALANSIDEKLYSPEFVLVEGNLGSSEPDDPSGVEDGEENSAWNSLVWAQEPEEIKNELQSYSTKDFVFVPQTLRQGSETRPLLVIQVPKQDVNSNYNPDYEGQDYIYYTGRLPYTMFVQNEDGPEYRTTLDFLPGYIINLETKLKPGDSELIFAPVTVEPWVWKGTFKPEARQAGIFNPGDLYALIDYYKANNSFWLGRYGFIAAADQETGTWTFQFNSGELDLQVDKIMGYMHPNTNVNGPEGETVTPPFKFDFRGRNQNYIMPNGEKTEMGSVAASQNILYNIVTANRGMGVTGAENYTFADLIDAYQVNSWTLFGFGSYKYNTEGVEPGPGKWTFNINEDLTLNYENIVAQMIPDENDYLSNFDFKIAEGKTVTVTGYPSGNANTTLVINPGEEQRLYTIVTTREDGIYSPSQLFEAMNLYNGDLDLEEYTTTQNGQLVFPVWRNFILDSASIQGGMNEQSGREYSFDLQGHTITLNQYDRTTYTNTTAQNLYDLMNLNKVRGIGSEDSFMQMIEVYNSTTGAAKAVSSYGYYCFNQPRWNFSITNVLYIPRADIEGRMTVENGRLPYSFSFNNNAVYIIEEDYNMTLLMGAEGQKNLVNILTGVSEDISQP